MLDVDPTESRAHENSCDDAGSAFTRGHCERGEREETMSVTAVALPILHSTFYVYVHWLLRQQKCRR